MKLKHCTIDEFAQRTQDKKIVCFGAYVMPLSLCNEFEGYHFENRIAYLVDNDKKKHGTDFCLPNGQVREILSVGQFVSRADSQTVLLITSDYFAAIIGQLDQYRELDRLPCYIYPFMKYDMEYPDKIPLKHAGQPLIPKTIHYFWFGRNKKNSLMEQCIQSWKKFCPDYRIIEWNEDNYDITRHKFMEQAYNSGKYSFVTDYARLDVVNRYGGIYFDTDVEVIKNIDGLLYNEAFFGLGTYGRIATGLGFGAVKQQKAVQKLLEAYGRFSFLKEDGSYDLRTNTIREAPVFQELGLMQKNKFQMVAGASVFPSDVMSPQIPGFHSYRTTCNTVTVHHNGFSWASGAQKEEFERSKDAYETIRARFCQEGED